MLAQPAFHRCRHADYAPAYIDNNDAVMLPWPDMVSGTFHLPRHLPGSHGIDGPMPHGFLNRQFAHQSAPAPRPNAEAGESA